MKSLYQKWTKSLKSDSRKGSRASSVTGSLQSEAEAPSARSQPGSRGHSKEGGWAPANGKLRPASEGSAPTAADGKPGLLPGNASKVGCPARGVYSIHRAASSTAAGCCAPPSIDLLCTL